MSTKEERRLAWEARESLRKREEYNSNMVVVRARMVVLMSLGFTSYQEYLKSDLWGRINARAVEGFKYCTLCGRNRPTQVHHRSYTMDVMSGADISPLVPVCGPCHLRIDFTTNGNKRTFADADDMCCKLLSRATKIQSSNHPCPTCGKPVKKGFKLCYKCNEANPQPNKGKRKYKKGKKQKTPANRCKTCKNPAKKGADFCRGCYRKGPFADLVKLLSAPLGR